MPLPYLFIYAIVPVRKIISGMGDEAFSMDACGSEADRFVVVHTTWFACPSVLPSVMKYTS
jgi:hypothetical protein